MLCSVDVAVIIFGACRRRVVGAGTYFRARLRRANLPFICYTTCSAVSHISAVKQKSGPAIMLSSISTAQGTLKAWSNAISRYAHTQAAVGFFH